MSSTGFSFNPPYGNDINGTQFGPTGGKGLEHERSGQIVTEVQYDKLLAMERMNEAHSNSIFPTTNSADLDISEGDIVYIKKDKGKEIIIRPASVGLSSMNGAGGLGATLFPNDTLMQREFLLNDKIILGMSRGDISYAARNNVPGVTIQTNGVNYFNAKSEMPLGYYVMVGLPDPKLVGRNQTIKSPYKSPSKVTLELEPCLPTTLSNMMNAHLSAIFMNPEKYMAAMGKTYRTTDAWANMAYNYQNMMLMGFLEILNTMMTLGIINVNFTDGNQFDLRAAGPGTAIPQRDLILGMAKAWSLLDDARPDLDLINVDQSKKTMWTLLSRQLMQTIFCADKVANYGFGWNRTTQRNDSVNPHSNSIDGTTSVGAFYRRQLTTPKDFVIGLAGAIQRQNDRFFGKIIRSANAGHICSFVS